MKTAVLLLIFNRPEPSLRVFSAIAKAKPPKLYIASDGPRPTVKDEDAKVVQLRETILQKVDWDCEVITLFRDKNLGCKVAVSEAITWFFEHESEGIILEDDCLPTESFFEFCSALLSKYKDDLRVWHIGGYKPIEREGDEFSYSFSRFPQIWGWATWADRWNQYEVSPKVHGDRELFFEKYEYNIRRYEIENRLKAFKAIEENTLDTWDFQWDFTVRTNNGLAIVPNVNLIHNIGFGVDATHTKNNDVRHSCNEAKVLSLPLQHPKFVMVHTKDDYLYGFFNLDNRFWTRVKRKLQRWIALK